MTAKTRTLQDIPPPDVIKHTQELFRDKPEGYENTIKDLTALHPGLLRTDGEFTQKAGIRPLIFSAVSNKNLELIRFFLDSGPPVVINSPKDISLLDDALYCAGSPEPHDAKVINALLDHPAFDISRNISNMTFWHMQYLMVEPAMPDFENARRHIARRIINSLPDHLLETGNPLGELVTNREQGNIDDENTIFLIRAMADRGLDLSRPASPSAALAFDKEGRMKPLAALLATGIDEQAECTPGGGSLRLLVQEYNEAYGCDLRHHAKAMLYAELRHRRESLLITPEGRATWQAQGMAKYHMLAPLFEPKNDSLFKNSDEQCRLAAKVHAALPERLKPTIDLARLLRSAPVAQPDNTAIVAYMQSDRSLGKEVV